MTTASSVTSERHGPAAITGESSAVLTITTDVLVVGGGLAALRSAYDALRTGARVTMAVKGKAGRSGSSAMTSAGYSSAISVADSPDQHYQDTLRGGRGLNDPRLVRIMADEAPERLRELVALGGQIVVDDAGEPVVVQSGDHTIARTASAPNHTGLDFTEPLTRAVADLGCQFVEMTAIVDLLVQGGRAVGAVGVSYGADPSLVLIEAGAIILGTGGAGRIFRVTSNPNDATGDGYALALRAGATLRDMEFVQFYPWRCIRPFEQTRMPIQPSTFVLGARLFNSRGERFMERYDPVGIDATTRDVAARGIYDQIRLGLDVRGGVRLDLANLSDEDWARTNPKPHRYFSERGMSFRDVEMIVSPEAHFFMGGVVVDEAGTSNLEALYAVGEAAGGLHGANRLDSNALPETQVFGARAGRAAGEGSRGQRSDVTAPAEWLARWADATRPGGVDDGAYPALRKDLQEAMWSGFGIVRDARLLDACLATIGRISDELKALTPRTPRDLVRHMELDNSLLVSRACVTAGILRTESRGAHQRLDFPERDDEQWLRMITVDLVAGDLRVAQGPALS